MKLDLNDIKNGFPGLTKAIGASLYEGCIVSLERSGHKSNDAILYVDGEKKATHRLNWDDIYDEQLNRSWADQTEATEYGAVCIIILIAIKNTGYTVIERAVKGDGFDYWLGDHDSMLFQKKARLEISGIFKGNDGMVKARYKQKIKQTNLSDSQGLPAYVGIVEFSKPIANFGFKAIK